MSFGERLKLMRKSKGFSQQDFANLINMSQPGYGKLENGQREPNLETLTTISNLLNVSLDYLIKGDDSEAKMTFGKRMSCLRNKIDLTQLELANKVEMSIYTIKSLETDRVNPSIDTFIKLADLFNVTADYLLGRTDD